jgi:NAD(P)-dependent dehydrogenase (short-subunit alcohol dehydrogenase family)
MNRNAVVTGAGSGVGRAIAITLVREGWNVIVLGRRLETLEETKQLAGVKNIHAIPCNIGTAKEVQTMADQVIERFGTVELLVNSAGTNAPKRSLEVLSLADYDEMIGTNLNGAFYCVQAFLPGMRQQGKGTIINIVSDAAKQASAKAGPAYVMSKFGLAGLTQSINAEEKTNGIRACSIFPGDIDTPLLNKRPAPPSSEARKNMLQPEDVCACAMLAINLPAHVIVEEILVRPR